MTFVGTNVQRGATPEVTSVDAGSVRQEVPHDQVVVGRRGDLKSRLRTRTRTVPGQGCFKHKAGGGSYLPVVLLHVQRAALSHFGRQHEREGAFVLSHSDVENPARAKLLDETSGDKMCSRLGGCFPFSFPPFSVFFFPR